MLSFIHALGVRGKTTIADIRKEPAVLNYIDKCVESVNARAQSRVSQIKRWRILDRDFSIEGGELTPTLKIKRKVIYKMHIDAIESLYQDAKL